MIKKKIIVIKFQIRTPKKVQSWAAVYENDLPNLKTKDNGQK